MPAGEGSWAGGLRELDAQDFRAVCSLAIRKWASMHTGDPIDDRPHTKALIQKYDSVVQDIADNLEDLVVEAIRY